MERRSQIKNVRHREVQFCEETKASRLINKPFFRQIEQIDENTFEVQSCKKKIKLNLPMQIGFFVNQYAKLRMLQLYFDFMDKYLDGRDLQYCEMETDSAYMAIAGQSVEKGWYCKFHNSGALAREAPWVSKSAHPRKFGNHVTVHRPPAARPSAPQGN